MGRQVVIFCDIEGPTTAADGAVKFGFEVAAKGRKSKVYGPFTLDLTDANIEDFKRDMEKWAKHARRRDGVSPSVRKEAPPVAKAEAPPVEREAVTVEPEPEPSPGTATDAEHEWETPSDATPEEAEEWRNMRRDARIWATTHGWPTLATGNGRMPYAVYPAWKSAMGWTGPLFTEWRGRQAAEGEPATARKPVSATPRRLARGAGARGGKR